MKKFNSKFDTSEVLANINIDFNNKTIEISNKLAQAVKIPKGDAYKAFTEFRAAYPGFDVKVIKKEVRKPRNSTSKITYNTMVDYVKRVHPEEVKELVEMHDAKKVDALTGKEKSVYSFFEIKRWFMDKYGTELAA